MCRRENSSASIRLERTHLSRSSSLSEKTMEYSDERTVTIKGKDPGSIVAALVLLLRTLGLIVGVDLSSVIVTVEAFVQGDTEPESSSETSNSDMPETWKRRPGGIENTRRQVTKIK